MPGSPPATRAIAASPRASSTPRRRCSPPSTRAARYAERFPDKVGRLALDGAIDPSASGFEVTLAQARGFEGALTAYLEDCLPRAACPFSGSVDAARDRIATTLHGLNAHPLPG